MTFDHLVLAGHTGCEATDQRLELDVVSLAEAVVEDKHVETCCQNMHKLQCYWSVFL